MPKSKKRIKNQRGKLLLETSVQISRFHEESIDTQLRRLSSVNDLYSSYFVLYEFKTGLIKCLIDFYLLVDICDEPRVAISSWSNRFKIRELKNKIILESLMAKSFKSIQISDKKKYLAQIESIIFWLLSNFKNDVKAMVGSFASDDIAKFEILSNADYPIFVEKYKNRKSIPLNDFWEKHAQELDQLLSKKDDYGNPSLKNIYDSLVEVKKDFNKANQFFVNKRLGDAVIAVDSPDRFVIASLDSSFKILTKLIHKRCLTLKV